MKKNAIAFTGPSNSGKTTLIQKLSNYYFSKNIQVAIIKHDPKDKAILDKKGKDSYKFSETKAEVVISSPNRTTLFSQKNKKLDEIIKLFGDFNILLVEGLREISLPRIGIFRNKIDISYLDSVEAIAIDNINIKDYIIPSSIIILNLNNINEILVWIEKNSKKL